MSQALPRPPGPPAPARPDSPAVHIRTYAPDDRPAVRRLYRDGRLSGTRNHNDDDADLARIPANYLADPRTHFWIAEAGGYAAGMVAVAQDHRDQAQVRRLRVDPRFRRRGIGRQLVGAAVAFCQDHGYLKVVLDTSYEQPAAIELFHDFGFQHVRTRNIYGKDVLDFYLNLYRKKPE